MICTSIFTKLKSKWIQPHKSCIICNNSSKFTSRRACVTNNFVSLGVAGSRKYVIRVVMFGGVVGFSYCSHFVLITVVWIAPHPQCQLPPPRFTNDTKRASKYRVNFLRYLKYLSLLWVTEASTVWRGKTVFTVQTHWLGKRIEGRVKGEG